MTLPSMLHTSSYLQWAGSLDMFIARYTFCCSLRVAGEESLSLLTSAHTLISGSSTELLAKVYLP